MVEGLNPVPATIESDLPYPAAAKLVQTAGLSAVNRWYPVRGGANNRVYHATTMQGRILLKVYFHCPDDRRDRLRGECCFYRLAGEAEPGSVPQVWGWDRENRLGLFGFVEGRKLDAAEVDAGHVRAAGQLVAAVNNTLEPASGAGDFPVASEAAFSLAEHFAAVERRMERLRQMSIRDDLDEEAKGWIRDHLSPAWNLVRKDAATRAAGEGLDIDAILPQQQRWISPSDFGFHNALLENGGRLRFFDFEYAGWDDPAKLVADFFCQPSVVVPETWWDEFTGALSTCRRWQPATGRRARLLLPVYRIKWCCILMNEFLPADDARRQYAKAGNSERRQIQLQKAKQLLQQEKIGLGFQETAG
jgi:hypothetical protein